MSICYETHSHHQQSNLAGLHEYEGWAAPFSCTSWTCSNFLVLQKWKEGEGQDRVDLSDVQYGQHPLQAECLLGSPSWGPASAHLPSRKAFWCDWYSTSRSHLSSSGWPCTLNLSWLHNWVGAICIPTIGLMFPQSAGLALHALPAQRNFLSTC